MNSAAKRVVNPSGVQSRATSAAPYADAMVDLPGYKPVSILPIVKSSDVTAAPIHTSLQAISVSGRTLKIMANSSVMAPAERRQLTDSNKNAGAGSRCPVNFPMAASAALKASDTRNRKPVLSTRPNDKKRFLSVHTQILSDLGLTLQNLFSAS